MVLSVNRYPVTLSLPTQQQLLLNCGPDVTMELVAIPQGEYVMGGYKANELPKHLVKLKSFLVGKYPVTQQQYKAIMGVNPSYFKSACSPVESVSWYEAIQFCQRLSQLNNRKVRLPSESEWEYIGRAGSQGEYFFGDNPTWLEQYAWYSTNSDKKTHNVGQKLPNSWGLHDILGNVWEWCQDEYCENYINAPTDGSPMGGDSKYRMLRGGSWLNDYNFCRCAYPNWANANSKQNVYGFRVAVSI